MDKKRWEIILSRFQARARGHFIRSEARRAREDFKEIVEEIDGSLNNLTWTEAVVPIPHFIDTDFPCQPGISLVKASDPEKQLCAPRPAQPPLEERGDLCAQLEKNEAERDESQHCKLGTSIAEEDLEQRHEIAGHIGEAVMESTRRSSSVWSSLEMGPNPYKGLEHHCSIGDVPRTPQALRLHKNTLTMELLWLQQAIDSRKKYLSLKEKLSTTPKVA